MFLQSQNLQGLHHDNKAGGGKLENPSHMNLRGVRPTLVFALGSDPLSSRSLTTWGHYWSFLPNFSSKKSYDRDMKEILLTVGLVRQDEEEHCSPGLGCRSGKPLKHFFKDEIYAVKVLMRKTGKNIDLLLHLRSIDISLQEILHHLQVACT